MAAYYKYNGTDPFEGVCEPPLFSKSVSTTRFGPSRFVTKNTFVLSGQIVTRCADTLTSAHQITKNLILKFAQNFKTFEIWGDALLHSVPAAFIESIQFPESKYSGIIPFQITISNYDGGLDFITDPRDEYTYTEENGCIVSINHNISCRALYNTPDYLDYARLFVTDRVGGIGPGTPGFSPYGFTLPSTTPRIVSSETVNKLTGEVSYSEKFIFDKENLSGSETYIYTKEIEISERDGTVYVSLNGKLQADVDLSIQNLRSYILSSLDIYNDCNQEYQAAFSTGENLNPILDSFTVGEDKDSASIDFTIVYKNKSSSDPFLIPVFNYSNNNGEVCFSANITIKSQYGTPAQRLINTKNYYAQTNWENYIFSKYTQYGYTDELSKDFTEKSFSVNNINGDISFSITYCNNKIFLCSDNISRVDYSMTFSPPIPQFSENKSLDGLGCYYVQNLGYLSRGTFSINGTCVPSKCASIESARFSISSFANRIMLENFNATDIILDSGSIDISEDKTTASFSFAWSGVQSQGLSNTYVFAQF